MSPFSMAFICHLSFPTSGDVGYKYIVGFTDWELNLLSGAYYLLLFTESKRATRSYCEHSKDLTEFFNFKIRLAKNYFPAKNIGKIKPKKMTNFLNTFRGRLLIILALLLIATLSVQFYLNILTERENTKLRAMQEQALVAGIALGANSMTSGERLQEFVKRQGQSFFDEKSTKRIHDIIIIDPKWKIWDSLGDEYFPVKNENGDIIYRNLKDAKTLPPLMEATRLGEDAEKFPNAGTVAEEEPNGEAHVIPIETNEGRFYIMVVLKRAEGKAVFRAAQPLIYTLIVLLLSSIVTFVLVWRFTRPIADLSKAARQVAKGDLSVRVPVTRRSDEIEELAEQFNEMTAELEKNRELEAQLQEAEKSAVVGRLGSAIAHEIRNPLNYINLTLDHLRAKFAPEDAEKSEDFDKLTAQLKSEVARINRQISDFLSYSRPADANLQPTNVRSVIEDSLRLVEAQAEDQNIKISVIERENVPLVLGDAEFLRSVFNNLFINAVQAMEANGGNLHVTISPDGDFVKIEISDTGTGITPENLTKIFEPYFSTKETGTGLGLAIVKKILDIHNASVEAASNENEGTKFTVKLLTENLMQNAKTQS
jgi:signal transduction histidine kinase